MEIGKSSVPGGGYGAFLTFLGARKLNRTFEITADERLERRNVIYEADTSKPLETQSSEGFGVSVSLTGRNLHGNYNSIYWPQTVFSLPAVLDTGNEVNVKLAGKNLHYDSEEEEEPLPFSKRFGLMDLQVESNYFPDNTSSFSNRNGLIDLGRYGPVVKTGKICFENRFNFNAVAFVKT